MGHRALVESCFQGEKRRKEKSRLECSVALAINLFVPYLLSPGSSLSLQFIYCRFRKLNNVMIHSLPGYVPGEQKTIDDTTGRGTKRGRTAAQSSSPSRDEAVAASVPAKWFCTSLGPRLRLRRLARPRRCRLRLDGRPVDGCRGRGRWWRSGPRCRRSDGAWSLRLDDRLSGLTTGSGTGSCS